MTLALGLPMSRTAPPPPAPAGGLLGPGGTQLVWAKAAAPDRASTQAAIVEVLSMASLLSVGMLASKRALGWRRCAPTCRRAAAIAPALSGCDEVVEESSVEQGMWFVFEAEYVTENGRANWNKPVPETMQWHGPFTSGVEADRVARARMWAKIDIYAHKARAVDLTVRE